MTAPASSIDPREVENFSRLAAQWWNPHGPFRPLHVFNPVRLGFIRTTVCGHLGRPDAGPSPFEGLRLLDVGCGGGLLSEPMARLGAEVTAIDASARNIGVASAHAAEQDLRIDYRCMAIEDMPENQRFDVILNMEVIEHVAAPDAFLRRCYAHLAPNGVMIVATLNRTLKSFALAIVGAEYVLGWLPRGTHDWSRFLTPSEIAGFMSSTSAQIQPAVGVSYNPLADRWALSADTAVNYMMVITRPAGEN